MGLITPPLGMRANPYIRPLPVVQGLSVEQRPNLRPVDRAATTCKLFCRNHDAFEPARSRNERWPQLPDRSRERRDSHRLVVAQLDHDSRHTIFR